jgi:hypothetical protein
MTTVVNSITANAVLVYKTLPPNTRLNTSEPPGSFLVPTIQAGNQPSRSEKSFSSQRYDLTYYLR